MPKDDLLYLGHMLDMARKGTALLGGRERAAYDADETLRLALAHVVQTIGEAARRVSPETRESHPEVAWPEIVGMRHKIVHDYMDIQEDILFSIATKDLPTLVEQLEKIIPADKLD